MALVFALGASLGSFINVVAWRVPLGRSVVRPGSACPSCGTLIAARDNIPVLSWLLVRGRCRHCKTPISFRYPLVELAAGLLAVALWLHWSGPVVMPARIEQLLPNVIVPFVLLMAFLMTLLALVLIDLDWFLLPDKLTLPLALLGLVSSFALGRLTGVGIEQAAIGAAIGGGAPLVIGLAYGAATGRVGLGGGDWKLLLAIGAWLGPKALPFVFFAGALQGLVAAVTFRRDFALAVPPALPGELDDATDPAAAEEAPAGEVPFRRLHVPFGPFLALAAIEWLFFGEHILHAFEAIMGRRS